MRNKLAGKNKWFMEGEKKTLNLKTLWYIDYNIDSLCKGIDTSIYGSIISK